MLHRATRYFSLRQLADVLELQASTWLLIRWLHCMGNQQPAGLGGGLVSSAGDRKTYRQLAREAVMQSTDMTRWGTVADSTPAAAAPAAASLPAAIQQSVALALGHALASMASVPQVRTMWCPTAAHACLSVQQHLPCQPCPPTFCFSLDSHPIRCASVVAWLEHLAAQRLPAGLGSQFYRTDGLWQQSLLGRRAQPAAGGLSSAPALELDPDIVTRGTRLAEDDRQRQEKLAAQLWAMLRAGGDRWHYSSGKHTAPYCSGAQSPWYNHVDTLLLNTPGFVQQLADNRMLPHPQVNCRGRACSAAKWARPGALCPWGAQGAGARCRWALRQRSRTPKWRVRRCWRSWGGRWRRASLLHGSAGAGPATKRHAWLQRRVQQVGPCSCAEGRLHARMLLLARCGTTLSLAAGWPVWTACRRRTPACVTASPELYAPLTMDCGRVPPPRRLALRGGSVWRAVQLRVGHAASVCHLGG
jgi:hypothetical protein